MPSKTLSGALVGLISKVGGVSNGPTLVKLREVKGNGDIIVNDGLKITKVFMTNDQPQQAGTQEWVLKTSDGTMIGLGRGR